MFGKQYQQTTTTNESETNMSVEDKQDDVVQTDITEVVEDKKNKGWQIFAMIVGLVILIVVVFSLSGSKDSEWWNSEDNPGIEVPIKNQELKLNTFVNAVEEIIKWNGLR